MIEDLLDAPREEEEISGDLCRLFGTLKYLLDRARQTEDQLEIMATMDLIEVPHINKKKW